MPDSTFFTERRPLMDASDNRAVHHSWVSSISSNIQYATDGSPTPTTPITLVSSAEPPSQSWSSQVCTSKPSEPKRGRLKSPKAVISIQSGTKQRDSVRRSGDKVAEPLSNYHETQSPSHERPKGALATPQPQREQATRDAKPIPSIEESTQKPFDRYAFLGTPSTPSTSRTRRYQSGSAVKQISGRRRREDEHYPWAPPISSSEELSFGESPIPPYGCSSRHHHTSETSSRDASLTHQMPRSSPDRQTSIKVTKRESIGLSPLAAQNGMIIVQTSPSPSIYNSDRRRRRLEKNGFVQQPAVDFAEHRLASARKEAALMEAIIEEGRRKLGEKVAEYCSDHSRPQTFEGTRKRESEDNFKASHKGQKTSGLIAAPSRDSQRGAQNTTAKHLEEKQEHMKIKVEQMAGVKLVAIESSQDTAVDDAEGSKSKLGVPSHIRERTLPPCGKPTLTSCAEHGYRRKAQTTRRWYNPQHRRELTMAVQNHPCTCQYLPGYFTRQGLLMPSLEHFPGGKLEFMTHIEQISNCYGHSDRLRNGCRIILEREKNSERCQGQNGAAEDQRTGFEDTMEWAQGFLSSDPSCDPSSSSSTARDAANKSNPPSCPLQYPAMDHNARLRQQSSIEPTRFYGQPRKFRRPLSFVGPSQSLSESSISPPGIIETGSTSAQLPMSNDISDHRPPTSSPSVAKARKRKINDVEDAWEPTDEAKQASLSSGKTKKLKKSSGAETSSCEADSSPSPKIIPIKRIIPSTIQPLPDISGGRASSSSGSRAESVQGLNGAVASQEPFIEDDWRPFIDDDDDLLLPTPPHLSPRSPDQDTMQSRDHLIREVLFADEDQDSAPRRSRSPPSTSSTSTVRDENFGSQRQRHQSLPAKLSSSRIATTWTGIPSPRQTPQRQPLQMLSPNLEMVRSVRDVEARLKHMEEMITQNLLPSITRNGQAAPAAPNPPEQAAEEQRPQRRRPTIEERKRRQPELSKDVPMDQRLSDPGLIEVGKRRYKYQRHVGAPYAFSWGGRLFAKYDRLLTQLNPDGTHGWNAKEKARVK